MGSNVHHMFIDKIKETKNKLDSSLDEFIKKETLANATHVQVALQEAETLLELVRTVLRKD